MICIDHIKYMQNGNKVKIGVGVVDFKQIQDNPQPPDLT